MSISKQVPLFAEPPAKSLVYLVLLTASLVAIMIGMPKLKTKKSKKKSKIQGHRMKSYESFDLWMADQNSEHKKLIKALRKLVNKTAPKLSETVKWGNGCWVGKEWPVLFLFAGYDVLQFGFFGGSDLSGSDPKKLLKGNGKFVRHIPVPTMQDIQETAFKKLIKQAAKIERED